MLEGQKVTVAVKAAQKELRALAVKEDCDRLRSIAEGDERS